MNKHLLSLLVLFLVGCGGSGSNGGSGGNGDSSPSVDVTPPLITSSNRLNINEKEIIIYQIEATDDTSIKSGSYTLSGADASDFTINTANGLVTLITISNYDIKSSYAITVGVSDSSDNKASLDIIITLNDVEEEPPVITSSDNKTFDENLLMSYQIQATDNVAIKANSYTLAGTDASYFRIDVATGLVTSIAVGDYESQISYVISVGVSDVNNNKASQSVTFTLNNLDDELPVITSSNNQSFAENVIISYQITATDNIALKASSFTLAGADKDYFTVNATTGLITSKSVTDYEIKTRYTINVGVSDTSNNIISQEVILKVNDLDEELPIITSNSIVTFDENLIINYQISATDNVAIKANSYTLTGTDSNYFTIDTATGLITSKISGDFETKISYAITVGVSDSSNNIASKNVTLALNNLDEVPPIILSSHAKNSDENQTMSYQIEATDNVAIKTNSYTLAGIDAHYFSIDTATGLVTSIAVGDYETQTSYAITVGVSDTRNNKASKNITLTLNNLDEEPPVITSNNAQAFNDGLIITYQIVATDNIAIKANSYTLSGTDESYFTIDTATGLIASITVGNYAAKPSYAITVGVSDTSDNITGQVITMSLIDATNLCSFKVWSENEYCYENGVSKRVVEKVLLKTMITNGDDVTGVYTGQITDMSELFKNEVAFNQDIGGWNTSQVTNMKGMFFGATIFDQDISAWDTQQVTSMQNMFLSAKAFNQNIGTWNTAQLMHTGHMFYNAEAFNQDIGGWITTQVTNMSFMFQYAVAFNQDIGGWNTAQVKTMNTMFRGASAFNQDISTWNTALVTSMNSMFRGATAFDQNIGTWNTALVTDMSYMFSGAVAFNQDIGGWTTSNVINMGAMFDGATTFNKNIGGWDTTKVKYMNLMFNGASAFNQDIGGWLTNNVVAMNVMFSGASSFNQNIGNWNTSLVTSMNHMFYGASAFNQSFGTGWNTSLVTNMSYMFSGASAFNQSFGLNWNTSQVTDMSNMFYAATAFNQDIGHWDTAKVINMTNMFYDADTFNQDIGGWQTGQVTSMVGMFSDTLVFNQYIGDWDTGKVTLMQNMFLNAAAFNQAFTTWDTSLVTNMSKMFSGALAFNQNFGVNWDTSLVKNMNDMFRNTAAFNQNISGWDVLNVTNYSYMFAGSMIEEAFKPTFP